MPLDPKTARLRQARLAREAATGRRENDHHRVFALTDEIPFGMHKGKTIAELIDEEIGYMTWLLDNTKFQLTPDAEREYCAAIKY